MRKLFIFSLLATVLAVSAKAQIHRYKAGDDLYYQIVTKVNQEYEVRGTKYQFDETRKTVWHFTVTGKTDSTLGLRCTLLGYDENAGGQMSSSADSLSMRPVGSRDLEMQALLNRNFPFTLHADGKGDGQGIADIFEARIRDWHLSEDNAKIMRGNVKGYLDAEMRAAFLNDSSQQSPGLGVKVQVTRVAPREIGYHPVSEDFVTVNVLASRTSGALLDGPVYDSAKVEALFKRYDPLFGRFNFYKLLKMELVQASNFKQNYDRYNDLLMELPDSVLAGNRIHLFNKMQAVKDISVDSAYHTLLYFSKYKDMFHEWMDQSYAQSFLSAWDTINMENVKNEWRKDGLSEAKIESIIEKGERGKRIAPVFLRKLANDSNADIADEVRPLSLWVEAKHLSNQDSVLDIARRLSVMNGDKKYGNAYRYSLLVYKQLAGGSRSKAAEALLDKQIDAMEKSVADSLNNERNADRNMLAYAYKLKSQAVRSKDSVAAENYLALAAANSPSKQNQKAYASFYDRVFLDSKESYRTEYAGSLIKHGNSKDAMRMISSQLNVDADVMNDLREAFTQSYPNKDFYEFFNNIVVKSWKQAPSFKLKSPDGKKVYSLEDYKGRWLLLDFWGTWCGPCREELPQVNAFAAKIKGRKDLAFLSIACHDKPEAVISYLTSQHFDLPGAMSDGGIEGDYGVPGFPSKYLISPNGSVLQIAFGQDWEKLVSEITNIKPGPNAAVKPKTEMKPKLAKGAKN